MKAIGWILAAMGLVGVLANLSPAIQADATVKYHYVIAILVFFVIGSIGLGLIFSDKKR